MMDTRSWKAGNRWAWVVVDLTGGLALDACQEALALIEKFKIEGIKPMTNDKPNLTDSHFAEIMASHSRIC